MTTVSLLNPLFLVGLLAVGVPVLIHLQRRHQSRTQHFPSLMFLERIQIPSRSRRRIRNWLLLALRSLALILLTLAFTRPWLSGATAGAAAGGEGKVVVVLLDNSFSMGYEDRWPKALEYARDVVGSLDAADEAAVVLFSDTATVIAETTADPALLQQALDDLTLSSRTTRFTPALRMAKRLFLESDRPNRELVLLSDLQASGWNGERSELPQRTLFRWVDFLLPEDGGPAPSNLAVASVVIRREASTDRERVEVIARIANRGPRPILAVGVSIELNGRPLEDRELELEADESKLVSFGPFSLPDGVSTGVLRLTGDALEADNGFFFVLSRAQALPVLVVDRPRVDGRGSGFYVQRALGLAREPPLRVRRVAASGLGRESLEATAVVVLSDVAMPTGDRAEDLVDFVEKGGGLLVALGSRTVDSRYQALSEAGLFPPLTGTTVRRGSGSAAARIAFFDRTHPGFEEFAAPRSGDFGSARFFRYHRLRPDPEKDQVLARFDDGEAALIERQVGRGRVLIWASTLDRYWNDFSLKPIFVPFVLQAIRRLSDHRPLQPWHRVGDVLSLSDLIFDDEKSGSPEAPEAIRITDPSGQRSVPQELLNLDQAGFFRIELSDDTERVLAVNVEASESDLTPLDPTDFAAAIAPREIDELDPGRSGPKRDSAQSERLQGLWRYLIVGVLMLLVGETFLSNRRLRGGRA